MATTSLVILIGRLGRDPELRTTADEQVVAHLRLATDRPSARGEGVTDWHAVACFGATARFAAQYLTKGRLVYVEGRLQYRTWESRDGVTRRDAEIVAGRIAPLDRRPAATDEGADTAPGSMDDRPTAPAEVDDDLPF